VRSEEQQQGTTTRTTHAGVQPTIVPVESNNKHQKSSHDIWNQNQKHTASTRCEHVCNIPETDIVKMQKAKNGSCDDEHFIVWLAERRMFLGKEIECMSNNFLLEKPRDCKDQNPTTTRGNWCKNFTPKKKKAVKCLE